MPHGHIADIRVSSTDQNTGRQLGPECGQQFTKTFEDKTSGRSRGRRACLLLMMNHQEASSRFPIRWSIVRGRALG